MSTGEESFKDFVKILDKSMPRDFFSFRYAHLEEHTPPNSNINETTTKSKKKNKDVDSDGEHLDHIPTLADTIAHLKLLKAFAVLRDSIVDESLEPRYSIKVWQVFITNAVRRFIIFITALKEYHNLEPNSPFDERNIFDTARSNRFIKTLDSLIPPLDVVMVWHAFLLNPKSFYDNCVRNDILPFGMFPLPLKRLSDSIDNDSFVYKPSEVLKDNYLDVVSSFTVEPTDLIYDMDNFAMYEQLVSISCPSCDQIILKDIPYTNDASTGFADDGFKQKINYGKCRCQFSDIITHEELRKRQLYADVRSDIPLPGLYKYFSNVISDKYFRPRNPVKINNFIKKEFTRLALNSIGTRTLEDTIAKASSDKKYVNRMRILLRLYLQMNLISHTVARGILICEDLVGCVLRQERFVKKMNEIDWLHSPLIQEGLAESVIRYSRFFKLLTSYEHRLMLVPTLDIDLIWHTHQLSMYYYFTDCQSTEREAVIDHDDKVEEGRLDDCFEKTARYYKYRFKQDYSLCHCWYCLSLRSKSQSKLKSIFGKKKIEAKLAETQSSPLFMNGIGITHISIHNAICIPNTYAEERRKWLEKKYKDKKSGESLPWQMPKLTDYYFYPYLFVVPPLGPIAKTSCQLYDNGLCSTVRDFMKNCMGVKGCAGAGCGGDPFEPNGDPPDFRALRDHDSSQVRYLSSVGY
ncbi:hypothetical protein G9P44_004108 [Scheffersomyces stipitis]|nr:hypothetical protein G9P44_004108 [Scheffersomyces stipitis]